MATFPQDPGGGYATAAGFPGFEFEARVIEAPGEAVRTLLIDTEDWWLAGRRVV